MGEICFDYLFAPPGIDEMVKTDSRLIEELKEIGSEEEPTTKSTLSSEGAPSDER